MIERTQVKDIMQQIKNQQQQKKTELGDIFKGMIEASVQAKNTEAPKANKAPDKQEAKPNAETPIDRKEKPSKENAKDKTVDSDSNKTNQGETAVDQQEANAGGQGINQSDQLAGNLMNHFFQAKDITIDPETKIYTLPARAEAVETIDANAMELKKQLDNALLLKPQIRNQFSEAQNDAGANTKDLEAKIKDLTGKDIAVEFVAQDKDEKIQGLAENNGQGAEGMQGSLQNNFSIGQSSALEPKAVEETAFEKIWIKVSDNAELTPKLAQELGERIAIVQTDAKNYEISLNPANLGKIFVKVTMENGTTNMEMHFSNKKTMELMAKDINQLSQLIANNRNTEVVVHMSETPANYLEQEQGEQSHAQDQEQREQQRQSEDFIHQLKESIKLENIAM